MPNIPLIQKFLFVACGLLGVGCLSTYFYKPNPIFSLKEISELVPNTSQDALAPFFVQQSFTVESHLPNSLHFYIFSVGLLISFLLLLIAFKRQASISWPFLLTGIFLWFGIQLFQMQAFSWQDGLILLVNQLSWIAIISLFVLFILSAQSALTLFLEIAHTTKRSESVKRYSFLYFFWSINLFFSAANLWGDAAFTFYLPSLVIGIFLVLLYAFQQIKRTNSFPFFPIGITLLGLSYILLAELTNNDPAIRAIESWILISQIIMCFLFPLFILTNFRPLVLQNLPIHKVIHKPLHVSMDLIHIGVLILGLAAIFAMNGNVYHQALAGKFNMEGDVYVLENDSFLAEMSYQKALQHSKLNAKSNLSLARKAMTQQNQEVLAYYLSNSQVKFPSQESSIALSELYRKSNLFFESLFELQKTYQIIGPKAALASQIAYAFDRLNQADSAHFYYQTAYELAPDSPFHKANYALSLQQGKIPDIAVQPKEHALAANLLALHILHPQKLSSMEPLQADFKPNLDLRDLSLLFNSIAYFKGKQSELPVENWSKDSTLRNFFPEIDIAVAMQDFYHQRPLRALEKIALLVDQANDEKKDKLMPLLEDWHRKTLAQGGNPTMTNLQMARKAIVAHPFSLPILQKSMTILPKKEAYEAALVALRWNPKAAAYYPIYAFQALELGELEYAKEAMNSLQKIDQALFSSQIKAFQFALEKAEARQKF